jgi:hypothetical protein
MGTHQMKCGRCERLLPDWMNSHCLYCQFELEATWIEPGMFPTWTKAVLSLVGLTSIAAMMWLFIAVLFLL